MKSPWFWLTPLLWALASAAPVPDADTSAVTAVGPSKGPPKGPGGPPKGPGGGPPGPGGGPGGGPHGPGPVPGISELPRLVIYYQTTHVGQSDVPISMLPLITEKHIALTHLIVCSFHINANAEIHLNDYPPSHPRFRTLWAEAAVVQKSGVRVLGMVGGAAAGSFDPDTLDSTDNATFAKYYGQLRDTIRTYNLQGMDLDVEQYMSQEGITRLVRALRADFGPAFEITLAPVASALVDSGNLSGFEYDTLEADAGDAIAFYNAQFYNGFGYMATPDAFEGVVRAGWAPTKIVVGQLTTPENGGGYVPFDELNTTISTLRKEYGEIGGIMGWEYFNSEPGGTSKPWEWAQQMTAILRPESPVGLRLSEEVAHRLEEAWRTSTGEGESLVQSLPAGMPNYYAWVTE